MARRQRSSIVRQADIKVKKCNSQQTVNHNACATDMYHSTSELHVGDKTEQCKGIHGTTPKAIYMTAGDFLLHLRNHTKPLCSSTCVIETLLHLLVSLFQAVHNGL